jgi:20S proteasome subunit beta 4
MDFFYGVKGKDFVMVVCDTSAQQSIISIKQDEEKIIPVSDNQVFCISGEAGDRVQFTEFIKANIRLYALRNSTKLSTKAIAHYTRGELATALRKKPYNCNLLIAGYDKTTGPALYWMDYLATMKKVNVGGTGYGALFTHSILDKYWTPEITQAEAVAIIDKSIEEIKLRLVVAPPHYVIKVIDANGLRTVKEV